MDELLKEIEKIILKYGDDSYSDTEAKEILSVVLSHFATDEQVRTELSKKIWRLGHVIVSQYEHTQPPSEDDYDSEKYTKSRERAENIADLILKDSILPLLSAKVEAAKRETAEEIFKFLNTPCHHQTRSQVEQIGWTQSWDCPNCREEVQYRFPASQKKQEGEQK